jgi:hypothetical protein
MSKVLAVLALAALVAFAGQAASATTRRVRGPLTRSSSIISERIRGASASIMRKDNSTNQVFQYDEALSPPAGH